MNRAILAFGLTLAFLFSYDAKAQSWLWAQGAYGSTGMSEVYGNQSITLDSFGNIYTVAEVIETYGPSSIGPYILPTGTFIIKSNAATGDIIWVKSGIRTVEYKSIITDGAGNLYFTGTFNSTLTFGTFTLAPIPSSINYFLVKFDSSGTVVWARQSTSIGDQRVKDIALDTSGNIYITGQFNSRSFILGTDTLFSTTCSSSPCYSSFLAKYNSLTGNVVWARSILVDSPGSISFIIGYSISTDLFGNVYTAGFYGDLTAPTTMSSGTDTVPLPGTYGFYIAKFDSSGHSLWIKPNKKFGVSLIRTDGAGNIYINGDFAVADTLGTLPLSPVGTRDIYFAKYDSSGSFLWAKTGGMPGEKWTSAGMNISKDGTSYIAGGKYPITTGTTFQYGTSTFTCSTPPTDLCFIIKSDNMGNVLSGQLLNSGGDDYTGILVDNTGNVFITGDYVDSLVLGTDTVLRNPVGTFSGHETYFLTKLCPTACSVLTTTNLAAIPEIQLYPNPATNYLTISNSSNSFNRTTISIYDVTGRLQIELPLKGNKTKISTEELKAGVYQCKINFEGLEIVNKKLIIVK